MRSTTAFIAYFIVLGMAAFLFLDLAYCFWLGLWIGEPNVSIAKAEALMFLGIGTLALILTLKELREYVRQ